MYTGFSADATRRENILGSAWDRLEIGPGLGKPTYSGAQNCSDRAYRGYCGTLIWGSVVESKLKRIKQLD
jgi:hypothetical protein